MNRYEIGVIPGDGIGIEVMREGTKLLKTLETTHGVECNLEYFDWGATYYKQHGVMMSPDGLDRLRPKDALLLGAVGHPDIQNHITLNGLLLPLRRNFDQYACVRPIELLPNVETPLAGKTTEDIDFLVVRENTEGEYSNVGGFQYKDFPQEVALQTNVFTRFGCERIARFAFELAVRTNRRKVTSITKSNAQGYSMVLWDEAFSSVAKEFPQIENESQLVDSACMEMVRAPEQFDVIVSSNLFGDILTDLGAAISGSIGLAPSANLNPTREFPSMFEPTHGSAPDIMGKGIANPLAQVLSVGMMLDFLDEKEAAAAVKSAVKTFLGEDTSRRPFDLGGDMSTTQVGDALIEIITKQG